jgi:hypothetical protein
VPGRDVGHRSEPQRLEPGGGSVGQHGLEHEQLVIGTDHRHVVGHSAGEASLHLCQERDAARAAGALVVLADGEALAYLERGGHRLVRFPAAADDHRWTAALAGLVDRGRFRSLELRSIDGEPVAEAPADVRSALEAAGFQQGYRGWTRRPRTR